MSHKINIPAFVEGEAATLVPVHEVQGFDPARLYCMQEMACDKFAQDPSYAGINGVENATLIAYRSPLHKGKAGSEIVRLVQASVYFEEVSPFKPLSQAALQERLGFAEATGFLLMGRDEALVVVHQVSTGYQFCDAFEVNSDGGAKLLHGFYPENALSKSAPRTIATLHWRGAQEELTYWRGLVSWSAHRGLSVNREQIERYMKTIGLIEAHLPVAPPERKRSGAIIERFFYSNGSTASVAHLRAKSQGWVRYPSRQDAWYFGQWINPITMEILCYCEGDATMVRCETKDQFRAELKEMASFYGVDRAPCAIGISETVTSAMFDFLFLGKGPSKVVQFVENGPARDGRGNWIAPLFGAIYLEHPAVLALSSSEYSKLPLDAFELDQLSPFAHEPYEVLATCEPSGYSVKLNVSGRYPMEAQIELQEMTS